MFFFWIAVMGLAVGVLVGLMGIGGGIVIVPALVYLLHFDQHTAQGTSLFMQLPPLGLGALYVYWKHGAVDIAGGTICAGGVLAGGYFGSLVASHVSSLNLHALFGMFLILSAFVLDRQARGEKPEPGGAGAGK